MKIGLLGIQGTKLLRTLQVMISDTDHEVSTFILSDIPGSSTFKITGDQILINGINLLEYDVFYLVNYRFFWGQNRFLSNSLDHWKQMPRDFIGEDIINFRESESVRASVLFILNQLNKLINPIEFFLLFEYKLWLFKLFEEYDLPVMDYHLETRIPKRIELDYIQEFLSFSGSRVFKSHQNTLSLLTLNQSVYPRIFKRNHSKQKYEAYLCGQQILFGEEDRELNQRCIPFLERVRNAMLEILNDWRFFCKVEFTCSDGVFLIHDLIPSPQIKDKIYLEKLTELIIKGGE